MQRLMITFTVALMAVVRTNSSAIPRGEKRGLEKELSDIPHEEEGDHNREFDHEAFLGREEAKTFDQLTPEESKQKLSDIVNKIDSDHDGLVSENEMVDWIRYIQKRYVTEDAKRQWSYYERNDGDFLTWEEYEKRTFGANQSEHDDDDEGISYKEMVVRDRRRFDMADTSKDGRLSFAEFVDFLHPENSLHMKNIVVLETMEDIDKDKNGVIDEKEYIGDMWPSQGEDEPDWVATEREHFSKWRDLNKDGVMDTEEVRRWIMPDDYDHAQAESKHLIYEADVDKDGHLTKDEIVDKYDLFVGSQATDFGEALTRVHDDL